MFGRGSAEAESEAGAWSYAKGDFKASHRMQLAMLLTFTGFVL